MPRHSASKRAVPMVHCWVAVIALLSTLTAAQQVSSGKTASERLALVNGPRPGNSGGEKRSQRAGRSDAGAYLPVVTYGAGGLGPNAIALGDFNGDGKVDVVVADSDGDGGNGEGTVGVLLGNGDGTFGPVVSYDAGGIYPYSLAVGDLNGDGKVDIVVGNYWDATSQHGEIAILLGNGDGTFQPPVTYDSAGDDPVTIVIADVNGDGKPDLVVANCAPPSPIGCPGGAGNGNIAVFLGHGDGTFRTPRTYKPGGYFTNGMAVADVNGDGNPDIIVANLFECLTCQTGTVGVLLGNGNGTFKEPKTYELYYAGLVTVKDVNGDGKPDLLVAAGKPGDPSGNGVVGVFLGNGDGTFQAASTYDSGGQSVSIDAVDVDGDGRQDVVLADWCIADEGDCVEGAVSLLLGNGDGSFGPVVTYDSGGFSTGGAVVDLNGDGWPDVAVSNYYYDTVGVLLNNAGLGASATALTSSLNPSELGQTVTFTAQVTSSSGTPTGTVIFYDGSTSIGSATLASGSASLSTSSLAVGSHSITAGYQGSSSFAPSTSAVLTQVVNSGPAPTSTSLASSFNPCVIPCHVTFTATVTSAGGTPTGTVIFYDGTTSLGSATLASGVALFSPAGFGHGTHPITAAYQGSGSFNPSTSPVLNQVVYERELGTRMTMTTSGTPSFVGQAVTFSISIQAVLGGEPPDGEPITFYDSHGVKLGTSPLSGGSASFTTSSLTAGRHPISAFYQSDGIYKKCHGLVLQFVDKYATTTTLVGSPNPAVHGQPITYTVTVTSSGPNPPTGSVKLTGAGVLPLVNGVASVTESNVKVGTHALTAGYKGDDDSDASTSPVLEEVVNPD